MDVNKLTRLEQMLINIKTTQPAAGDSLMSYSYSIEVNNPALLPGLSYYTLFFETYGDEIPLVMLFSTHQNQQEALHPSPGSTDTVKRYKLTYYGPCTIICTSTQPGHLRLA